MGKKKFYAVAKGRKPGIYLTWPECQEQVSGYPKAQFAAFETMDKAVEYHNKHINEEYAQNLTNAHIHQLAAANMTCAAQQNQSTEQQILQPTVIPSFHNDGSTQTQGNCS
jgi:viroplasmin and RNaseH domain-containing protein